VRILVIDDDPDVRRMLDLVLRLAGHTPEIVADGELGIALARERTFDAAIVDLKLLGRDGLAVIGDLHDIDPALPVILITAFPDFSVQIGAVARAGRYAYLQKPFVPATLLALLERAARKPTSPLSIATLDDPPEIFEGLVGATAAMRQVFAQIRLYAPTRETILILGESGTGKEGVARSIHVRSGRTGPFVPVNCASIPDGLVESELFGHEAGAFTGAAGRRTGKFEAAHGGTLFLDEIGELAVANQAKILRALELREVTRVGDHQAIRVDVRVVAATNRDLRRDAGSSFRLDLYHRLAGLQIRLPPLRERLGDLLILVRHLLPPIANDLGLPPMTVSDDGIGRLAAHGWPGNVRELLQVLKRAALSASGTVVNAEAISAALMDEGHETTSGVESLAAAVARAERLAIARAMATFQNVGDAARALQIDPKTLYVKRRQYGNG
jgi:two-component system response regulator HydG